MMKSGLAVAHAMLYIHIAAGTIQDRCSSKHSCNDPECAPEGCSNGAHTGSLLQRSSLLQRDVYERAIAGLEEPEPIALSSSTPPIYKVVQCYNSLPRPTWTAENIEGGEIKSWHGLEYAINVETTTCLNACNMDDGCIGIKYREDKKTCYLMSSAYYSSNGCPANQWTFYRKADWTADFTEQQLKDLESEIKITNAIHDHALPIYLGKLENLSDSFYSFVHTRERTVEMIWELTLTLEATRRGIDISQLVGHTLGVASGVLGLGALIAAPFTGGGSLVAWTAAVGVGFGLGSGVTSVVTDLYLAKEVNKIILKHRSVLDNDDKTFLEALEDFQALYDADAEMEEKLKANLTDIKLDFSQMVGFTKKMADVGQTAKDAVDAGKEARQTMKVIKAGKAGLDLEHKQTLYTVAAGLKKKEYIDKVAVFNAQDFKKSVNAFAQRSEHWKKIPGKEKVTKLMLANADNIFKVMGPITSVIDIVVGSIDLFSSIKTLVENEPHDLTTKFLIMSYQLDVQRNMFGMMVEAETQGTLGFKDVFIVNEATRRILNVEGHRDVPETEVVTNPRTDDTSALPVWCWYGDGTVVSSMAGGHALEGGASEGDIPRIQTLDRTDYSQRWVLHGGYLYTKKSLNTLTLSVEANGEQAVWAQKDNSSRQKWRAIESRRGYLRVLSSGMCVSQSKGGTQVVTSGTRGEDVERWILGEDRTLMNVNSGLCLEVTNSFQVQVGTCRPGLLWQQWTWNDNLTITCDYAPGKVLDVYPVAAKDEKWIPNSEGARVILWSPTGGTNQQFIYTPWEEDVGEQRKVIPPATSPMPAPGGEGPYLTYGAGFQPCDGEGDRLTGTSDRTLEGCKRECDSRDQCTSFKWNEKSKRCIVRAKRDICNAVACEMTDSDRQNWHWYYKGCSHWSMFNVGFYPCDDKSDDLKGKQVLDLGECRAQCDETDDCNMLSWNSNDRKCYLKQSKQDVCDSKPCALKASKGSSEWSWHYKECVYVKADKRAATFACDVTEKVYITSPSGDQLQDNHGNVKMTGNKNSWEQWSLSIVGDSYYIASHRDERLQDDSGWVEMDKSAGIWERWHISDAGSGKVFITSHRGKQLTEGGWWYDLWMSQEFGSKQEWTVRTISGKNPCSGSS